tara:strand:+ start:73 stop:984 length:912 start_codon:yes stop_codon:yes gene_type:complete
MYKELDGHSGNILHTKNKFDIIDCTKCQFKHIVPIPIEEDLIEVYQEEYYSDEKPLYIERMKEDLEWWNLSYDDRYDSFEKLLDINRRKVLDVGSGPGFFLNRGKDRGWDTTGIEPSKQAYSYSSKELGLNIFNIFLNENTKKNLEQFDVVHMSQVLEHIPNPKILLDIVYEKLNSKGLICVVVPNEYNPFQNTLIESCSYDPWWVAPPHHINYFSFQSLTSLLEEVGFKILLKETTFPMDMFLLMGKNYVGNDELGRECHIMRKQLELNLAKAGANNVKRDLYRSLAKLGIGREIILIGEKE